MKWVILAVLFVTCAAAAELECYNCVEGAQPSETTPNCSMIASPRYKQFCAVSTLCVEIRTELTRNDHTTRSSTFGCADPRKVRELLVDETVPTSCIIDSSNTDKDSVYGYCFCKGNLCNKPKHSKSSANSLNSLGYLNTGFAFYLLNKLRFLY